ncbi:MAG TPA: CYTH domain-containing protein [Candidatus Paceibacterota bacterium]
MQYEVEVKSLLGSGEKADALRKAMCARDPQTACVSHNRQLNHYFVGGTIGKLAEAVGAFLPKDAQKKFETVAAKARECSVRTRLTGQGDKDGKVLLVIKASVGDDTSANGVSRMEFEEVVPLSLHELDAKVLEAGFSYQAKWSREREEYLYKGLNVCLDRNAGYGYVAEFEKMVDEEADVMKARDGVRALMAELGAEELSQDRLERMFAHYNANWQDYYGTDKIFTIN